MVSAKRTSPCLHVARVFNPCFHRLQTGATPLAAALVAAFFLIGPEAARAGGPDASEYAKGSGYKFLNLRYDEDFRYFDEDPEAYASDARNRLKNIHLGENWRLDLGGEFRARIEGRSNPMFGRERRTQNTQQNYRWLFHANIRKGDAFRIFVQGIASHVEDRDGPIQPQNENHGDLQQLFFDWRFLGEETPLTLRLGRQELQYGNSRFVGPLEWVSNRRRFEAVKLFYEGQAWNIDAFFAKPVAWERAPADHADEEVDFYGLYTTYKGVEDHGVDIYFFALEDKGDKLNPNFRAGDMDVYTLGTRIWGRSGPLDYNTELTGQWGHWARDDIRAWSWVLDLGYTFDHTWRPRVSTGIDMTSGDNDPFDRTVGTLNPLFPFNNVCVGYLDLIGRSNMNYTYLGVDAWPVPNKLKTSLFYNAFWLQAQEDFLYDAGGGRVLRDPTGRSGKELGHEIDVALEWIISEHSSLWLAYAYFFTDNYIDRLIASTDDPQLFIVQYQYKF